MSQLYWNCFPVNTTRELYHLNILMFGDTNPCGCYKFSLYACVGYDLYNSNSVQKFSTDLQTYITE